MLLIVFIQLRERNGWNAFLADARFRSAATVFYGFGQWRFGRLLRFVGIASNVFEFCGAAN